jgi:cysteine desulfurase/selenocysteine lyase
METTSTLQSPAGVALDVARIREDFPILQRLMRGKPLVYLDNAATTQKPQQVIDRLTRYYSEENANIHRGVYALSADASEAYAEARTRVQRFLNAASPAEIIFTRGTTEGLNLIAQTHGRTHLQAGDEILVSDMEHHSNIVPWQIVAEQTGAALRVIPITDAGELDLDAYRRLLNARTRLVSVVHVSNALGTINPIREIVAEAHRHDIPVVVDGAQAVSHMRVDVQALDCDFYVLSGHKLFGPTGIGALYGTRARLEALPPYQGGGDMIRSVSFDGTTYNDLPHRFEAGTPHISGALGLAAAIDYIEGVGLDAIAAHDDDLVRYGRARLTSVPGVTLVGTAPRAAGVISFVMDVAHPHDIGTIVDGEGVAVRTGHHCCQPLMHRYGIAATARASVAMYNTRAEIDRLAAALEKVREVFA